MRSFVISFACAVLLSGCALDPYRWPDPSNLPLYGEHPNYPDYVKSLRCEMTTFLVENKLRGIVTDKASGNLRQEFINSPEIFKEHAGIIKSNPNISLDSKQMAYLFMDSKNIYSTNASFGYDWKKPSIDPKGTTLGQLLRSGDFRDDHIGPSYVDTLTSEFGTPIGIAQYSDLGPADDILRANETELPMAVQFSTAYRQIVDDDADFYCYKSLYTLKNSSSIEDAARDIQDLLVDDVRLSKFRNFERIRIEGQTLAKWFQDKAAEWSYKTHTLFDTSNVIVLGEFFPQITLDAKPGLDLKYTLIASASGYVPEINASLEHITNVQIVFNTPNALIVNGAKTGNSSISTKTPLRLPKYH